MNDVSPPRLRLPGGVALLLAGVAAFSVTGLHLVS